MSLKISNSIIDDLEKSSLLMMSLMGVRTLLERELRINDMIIATEDGASKELLRRLSDVNQSTVAYPYGYLSLSELTAVKDRSPNKLVKRHGIRLGTYQATLATSKKAFIFPAMVQISMHYLDNDPIRLLRMAEALLILGQIGPLTFTLTVGGELTLNIQVEIPESATIPVAETENTHAPDAQELEIPLVLHTYVGFFRDVAAVNSTNPTVSIELQSNYLPDVDN